MSHFQIFVVLASAIYLAECLVYAGEAGWILLGWGKAFTLHRGPGLRSRNPWPAGFCYRFPPSSPVPNGPSRLSLPEAKDRYQDFLAFDRTLKSWSRILIGLGATAFLLFVLRKGFWLAWGLWAFAFLFVHLTLVVVFWRGFGKLYPEKKWARIRKTLLCAVSPWLSSRAMDLLADPLFDHFHPLVAGKLLLADRDFEGWARRWVLELRYPPALAGVAEVPLLLEKDREGEERTIVQWLQECGLETVGLWAPMAPTGPQDRSYCPRCEVAYRSLEGSCKDCGRDLVPFGDAHSGVG
ncbi:MAG TPA: DUF202 domain-containing protein [bacterium]|nr:DUF202 domain-containing protein [bacterium]